MPLFGSKFSIKKTPVRKIATPNEEAEKINEEIDGEDGITSLTLGNNKLLFQEGTWIAESGDVGTVYKENQKLRKHIKFLEEEKNMLILKFEALLNITADIILEGQIKDKEIQKLKEEYRK